MPNEKQSPWMDTMIAKLGSRAAVSEWMAENGRKQKGAKKPLSGTASLTPEERRARSSAAGKARWEKERAKKAQL